MPIWWTHKTFPIWYFSHPSPKRTSSNCPFPQEASKWMSLQISFEKNDWILNVWPWFGNVVSWEAYPYIWTLWLWNFELFGNISPFIVGCKRTPRRRHVLLNRVVLLWHPTTLSLLISHFLWVQPKYRWSRKDVGSPKSTSLLSSFHIGSRFCFFPDNFMSSTYTDKNNPFSGWTKRHSQFGIFSHPCFNRNFSHCLSHNSPAKEWPYRFRSRGTTGSSILDHDFGHLCRGRRIQMSGHSDFWIFHNCEHLPFYLGISRYCISCLSCATRQSGDDIHDLSCCHVRRRRTLFSKVQHERQSRLLQGHLGKRLVPCFSVFWFSLSIFWDDRCPSK